MAVFRNANAVAIAIARIAALSCCCALVSGVAGSVALAAAQPTAGRTRTDPVIPRPRAARNVGVPASSLVGGVELRERAELRLRWPDGPRWARPRLVRLLVRAAESVDRRYPGSVLLVGDLSSRDGGSLPGHLSHRSGRDADVAFYYADARGNQVRSARLLPVRASGAAPAGLRFDEARNWALIEVLLSDSTATVKSIFVAAALKHRLLEYAGREGIGADLLARADAAMRQPARGRPHDDHFHVRIAE
jgi:penicillin-insensitive murein endopeptidase